MSSLRIRMQPCETRPGEKVGPIGSVDPDEAVRGPVGEDARARTRTERDQVTT